MAETLQYLQNFINTICHDTKAHICFHDPTGFTSYPSLHLGFNTTAHSTPFCSTAKITKKGMRLCFTCKTRSNNKAIKSGKMFIEKCPYGLTEIVCPIVTENGVESIIYMGNLVSDRELVEKNVKRLTKLTHVSTEQLLSTMDTLQDFAQIEHYVNIVNAVRSYAILISKYYGKESYNQQHWAVTLFQNYVKKNYNTDVTITKLAKLYNLNEKYIGRIFKTQTNMSFNQYLNNVRVIEAKVLLRETEANIINISLEVGFNNVTYFNRVFKEIVGKTPLEYRESKRLL